MNGCFTKRTNVRNVYYLAITIFVVARNVRKRGRMRKLRVYKRLVIELLNFLIDLCFYYDRIYRKENNPFLSDMYEHSKVFNQCLKEIEGK